MATTEPDQRVEVRHEGMIESVWSGTRGSIASSPMRSA